jgi:peptidylprolyl isomerase
MKVGGKRLLILSPELAFGPEGAGEIPPNATVIMEIELVDVREPIKMTEVDAEDYITTDSGLKYYDIVEGDGNSPTEGQMVVVHYTGWLEDGTQFDSSVDRGEPFTFQLGAGMVIPGWDEGVATMKVGGKRQLVIPPELGYGEAGSGGVIPPGATLIFDVELLEIQSTE